MPWEACSAYILVPTCEAVWGPAGLPAPGTLGVGRQVTLPKGTIHNYGLLKGGSQTKLIKQSDLIQS